MRSQIQQTLNAKQPAICEVVGRQGWRQQHRGMNGLIAAYFQLERAAAFREENMLYALVLVHCHAAPHTVKCKLP